MQAVAGLDTAEVYGSNLQHPGHNEKIIGKAVAGCRQNVATATKLYLYPDEIGTGITVKDAVKKHLEKSLYHRIRTLLTYTISIVSIILGSR